MKRILVTGGDGLLGRNIVQALQERGQQVRIMSRKPAPATLADNLEWAQADVTMGTGLEAALQDVHTIVNCMSNPLANTYDTDISGLRTLLAQAKALGVNYIVHISIIGIDRIILPYYQYKLGSEIEVMESGIPYLITRIAQFHEFVDYLISPLREVDKDEVAIPVDVKFHPISPADVAVHLAPHIISGETVGRLPDFGGSQILNLREIVSAWLDAQGMERSIKPATATENDLPFFNNFGDGFVNGYNTNPDNLVAGINWQAYLQQTYGQPVK